MGNRVMWMVTKNVQHAEIRLNPAELGPLEVRVAVNRDETSILFTSQHMAVRDAVEAALPRLRSKNWAKISRVSEVPSTIVPIALISGVTPRLIDE